MGVQGGLIMENMVNELAEIILKVLDWIDLDSKKDKIFEKCLKRLGVICLCNTIAIIGLLIAVLVLYL